MRLHLWQSDAGMAANVGGPARVTYKSFDVDLPEVEHWLRAQNKMNYVERGFHGIELIPNLVDGSSYAQEAQDE
jgi:hypothetical protein